MSQTVIFNYATRNYIFRRPVMGNSDDISFQRINRRSRGGDLIVFKDPDWPKTEVLNLTFDFDKEKDYQDMLYFIRLSIGQLISYRDHENRLWSGVIQNPETAGSQPGLNSFQINILFEGDQV